MEIMEIKQKLHQFKKKDVIVHPGEYRNIFSEYATVLNLETDYRVFNWKKTIESVIKPLGQWHFQFAAAKRISILKTQIQKKTVLIKGESNYKSDLSVYKSVLKREKTFADLNLELLPMQCEVKPAKLRDVDVLLKKHYGSNWRHFSDVDLSFYKRIIDNVIDSYESITL
ncbi:hypothetical protein ABEB36_014163 [Hypothenemus hampei]|uniref:Uncharacterized protein n=1 Tax=Hypothenemus hampei TaxID=57062 RepID=A0ABD1E3U4_HYPHA